MEMKSILTHPVDHGARNVVAGQQLGIFPLEGEVGFENVAMPIRNIGQGVHPGYHGDLARGVTEGAIDGLVASTIVLGE